jgi:hypothetical protein
MVLCADWLVDQLIHKLQINSSLLHFSSSQLAAIKQQMLSG